MTRTIVVFGSTGVQGISVIEALAEYNPAPPTEPDWRIIALTRNPNSAVAKRLASIPNVICHQVAENNQDEPEKVFTGLQALKIGKGEVYGVVSIQGYVDDPTMIRQGTEIAKASKNFGVQHFIYSSSDIGPPAEEDVALRMKTFGFKSREIEPYIRELFPGQYTMLRPTQFMDMILPTQPFPFRAGRWVMLRYTYTAKAPNKIHQMISPRDIGRAAAKAFVEGPGWMNGVVRLAGWQGEPKEIEALHREIFGKPIQGVPWPLPLILKRFVPFLSDFCDYWSRYGYRVDIPALRQEMPELEDLRAYLAREKARLASERKL